MKLWAVYRTFYGEPILKGVYTTKKEARKHLVSLGYTPMEDTYTKELKVNETFEEAQKK